MKTSNDNQTLTIALEGRLDTAAANNVNMDINKAVAEAGNVENIVIDAANLEFISSSGLRIIISLKKKCANLSVINTSAEVYNVFEITGFTKIIDIRKALREVSIEGCEEIGRGGVGIVYRTAPDEIVKVFREGSPIEDLEKEISMAKEAFVLGMPTAISFDVVKVGNQLGLVYEMLDAETLATAIRKNPEKLEEYAVKFAQLARSLHNIEVEPGGIIPNAQKNEDIAIDNLSRYFSQEDIELLHEIQDTIPQGNRLLHCDFHPKNVMLQGDDMMLIDMGEVGYGNPLMDLAHTCSSLRELVGDYELITGLTEEQAHRFYDCFINEYFADESAEDRARLIKEVKRLSVVRNFSWMVLPASLPEEVVMQCKRVFDKKVRLIG